MKTLASMPDDVRRRVRGVLADIDDTITTHGHLTPDAYAALARGNSEDATMDLEGVLFRDPKQALAYVRLAQIALDNDQEARALVVDALARQRADFRCTAVETEFWGAMASRT